MNEPRPDEHADVVETDRVVSKNAMDISNLGCDRRDAEAKFIVYGASRSGKSVLSRRLQAKYMISWILGDAIVSSMEDAFPHLGIAHHGHLQDIGDKFADYVKFLLWHYSYAECGYVFDATHLYPRHIVNMRAKIGNVPAIFLGYAEADPEKKLEQIRQFDPKQNWWAAELSEAELRELFIVRSQRVLN